MALSRSYLQLLGCSHAAHDHLIVSQAGFGPAWHPPHRRNGRLGVDGDHLDFVRHGRRIRTEAVSVSSPDVCLEG